MGTVTFIRPLKVTVPIFLNVLLNVDVLREFKKGTYGINVDLPTEDDRNETIAKLDEAFRKRHVFVHEAIDDFEDSKDVVILTLHTMVFGYVFNTFCKNACAANKT